jgi:hypothetical protein
MKARDTSRSHGNLRPRPALCRRRKGAALVLALAALVLILGIVLAFFSRAALQRQISASSASNTQVDFLAESSLKILLGDIRHEMEAGSMEDPQSGADVPLFRPLLKANGTAPSLSLQRVGASNIPTILKTSRAQLPFFTAQDGYRTVPGRPPNGLARASDISTTAPSANGRRIAAARWNHPKFMTAQEAARFVPPDWIYLDREGKNPTNFSNPSQLANAQPDNPDFVLGRFAYVIYDEGGLLDITAIGNNLSAAENARKGRAHQITLANGIAGIDVPKFSSFVAWRSPITSSQGGRGTNELFDPKRDFIGVPADEQTFLNRQDLLKFCARSDSPLPPEILPFVTTYSRDVTAPAFGAPRSLTLPAAVPATEFNPPLSAVRFPTRTTLNRPEGALTVPAGRPVLARKFPLGKIDLLSASEPDAEAIRYYFGLEKNSDGKWHYVAHEDGRIAKLSEVAAQGREPNFFEVLQAAIERGSLARNGGDTYTFDNARAANAYLHILQIGANIIDQWDGDDFPTTLAYFDIGNGLWEDVYGIENLPYINNLSLIGYRPAYDRDRFQIWGLFDVWNPHQNAVVPPSGIEGFRIAPLSGRSYSRLFYNFDGTIIDQTDLAGPKQSVVDLNADHSFEFSPGTIYSEPTVLRGNLPPATANDRPGILFQDFPLGPAVPEYGSRPAKMQAHLDTLGLGGPDQCGVKAHNVLWFNPVAGEEIILALQARINGEWKTYQVIDGLVAPGLTNRANNSGDVLDAPSNTHHSKPDANLENCFYSWRSRFSGVNMSKVDPRTIRFGHNGNQEFTLGTTIRGSSAPYTGTTSTTQNNWRILIADPSRLIGDTAIYGGIFERQGTSNQRLIPLGFIVNAPEGTVSNLVPARYRDVDGIIRPADGYLGALPTVPGQLSDRPLILNRPFRSVAEMGYAFRDLPWKTMDFFSRESGDVGLLEAFTCDDLAGDPPLVAGKVNLNTGRPEVLEAILTETALGLDDLSGVPSPGTLSEDDARDLAAAIVTESAKAPFLSPGDLVKRVLAPASATNPQGTGTGNWAPKVKTSREAAIRSLAGMTTTRTWNLMIDLVVQQGRFSPSAKSGADFVVRAERRYWVHLTIDRITGEVVDQQLEIVNE